MTRSLPATRSEMQALQLQKLNDLLMTLSGRNPFYNRKLQQSGLTLPLQDLDSYFSNFPFTRKHELVEDQAAEQPFGSNLTWEINRYNRFSQTSGTTSAPLRWLDTPESWRWMTQAWQRVFAEAGVTAKDHVFFAFSFGPFLGFWTAYDAAVAMGCLTLPGGGMSSIARLHLMRNNGVTTVCCTPTYALHLGELAKTQHLEEALRGVRALIVAGEPGGNITATRERLQELWPSATVFDQHGMTEIGPVTYSTAAQPGNLFVIEQDFIPEVLNQASDAPVAPGEVGELVLTNLGRTGSPLLRYRTGDLVRPLPYEHANGNGVELGLEGGIIGRADDMLTVRGVNVYPASIEDVLHRMPEIAEYRVLVSDRNKMAELAIEIELQPGASDSAGIRARVEQALNLALALRIPVTKVPAGSLPRFEMKAKRWQFIG